MEEQLQQNDISGVWRGLKTISGHREPDNQTVGTLEWVNDLNLFFNRFDQSPAPSPAQSSLLQPPSSAPPVHCLTPTSTPLPTVFSSQLPPHCLSCQTPPPPPTPSNTQPPCSNLCLTTTQVRDELRRIRARKATGPDGISSRLLKSCADQLCEIVEHLFNTSLKLGRVPQL
ncbi:RNA-directed DNA polymerase from mobile element jockey-like, partial, partial [Lates japonicus]